MSEQESPQDRQQPHSPAAPPGLSEDTSSTDPGSENDFAQLTTARLSLQYERGEYEPEYLARVAARADWLARQVDKRLKPLVGPGRNFPRLALYLQSADGPAKGLPPAAGLPETAPRGGRERQSPEAVAFINPQLSERELADNMALAMVHARLALGEADFWLPPVDQADAEAIANALAFLAFGLARHLGSEAERENSAPLGQAGAGRAPRQSADQVCRQVAADREGKVPLYECLMRGPGMAGSPPEYAAIAESFCGYLFEREGPKAYRRFVKGSRENPSAAADLVYGKTLEQLQDEWLGAILRGQGRRPVSLATFARQIVPYLRPYTWLVVLTLLLMFLAAGVAQVAPFAIRDIIDIIGAPNVKDNPGPALTALYTKLGVLALASFVNLCAVVWLVYLVNVVGQNVLRDLRLRLTDRLHHLGAGFYARHRMGDMITRFTSDIPRMADPLVEASAYSIYHLVFLIATTISMFILSWQLSSLLFMIVPIYIIASRKLGPAIQVASRARQERLGQLNANLEEMLFGHALVKAYGLSGHLMTRFRPKIGEFRKVAIWTDFLRSVYKEVIGTVDNVQTKLVFALGGTLVVFGQMTTGTIIGFQIQMGRFIRPLHALSSIYALVAVASASLRRLEEILREPMETMDTPPGGTYAPEQVREGITFEDVHFSYTGAEPTLIDINVHIQAGSKVAFVGPTGAGKSTLVNLIPRFYDVDEGAVKIDGQDIRSFSLAGLRQSISIVSQDTFLFNSTIMENIRLGRLEASDDEVIEAAKGARLHDFIEALPAGYDTLVGERGWRLSGGQKQRIAIARALLRKSPILILDEATSSLDAETESEILSELDEVTEGKTVISITHRLGLAIKSDRICVLQAGRIVQQGSHEELIAQPALYRKLFEDQNRELIRRGAGEQPETAPSWLRSMPAFSMVPAAEAATLSPLLKIEHYKAGQVFCQRNGANGKLYLLQSGQVELTVRGEEGVEQRVYIGSPDGENGAGKMPLLLNIPQSASALAVTDTELQVLQNEHLRLLLDNGRHLADGSATPLAKTEPRARGE